MSENESNKEITEAKKILSHSSLSYSYLNEWGIENDILCKLYLNKTVSKR